MEIVPNQLRNERFILSSVDKKPVEKAWTTSNNYTAEEIEKKNPVVYGVLCGYNNLMVIDCDQRYVQEKLMQIEDIRNTFIVKTANKQLYHFYFRVKNTKTAKGFRIDNAKGERIIDLQGVGTYVVAPGSELRDGKKYEIVNPHEISEIDIDLLTEILKNVDDGAVIISEKEKNPEPVDIEFDEVCGAIKSKLKISDLLPEKDRQHNPTMCPLGHTSQGGKCFSYTDKVWKCFHCGEHGNIFQLYQLINKTNFVEAKRALATKAGLTDDLRTQVLMLYGDDKKRHLAVELLSRELMKMNRIYTIRTDKDPEMWIFKEGIYEPNGRTYIKEFIQSIMGSLYKVHFANQVTENIITKTYIKPDQFFVNEDLNLVPVLNGILNLRTRKLERFDPKYKFFNKLPVNYDPLIKPDKVLQFFDDIFQDKNDMLVVQELFGYLLYREYKFEKAWMFLGKGRNGKGKLISLMERFLGVNNVCNVSLQTLETDKWAGARLFNKMANLSADLSKTGLKDTGLFKSLTGRDMLTADRKFLQPVNFRNYAKMIYATNELPYTYDETDGFWDRWIIIDFVYKFVDDPVTEAQKKIDREILERISTDQEMTGLLNWALDGLDRLFTTKRFSNSTSTEQIKTKWKRMSSSFSAFIMDEVVKDYTAGQYVTKQTLNSAYTKYCEQHELIPETQTIRKLKLTRMGAYEQIKKLNNITERVWAGIRLKNFKAEPMEDIDVEDL